MNQWYVKDLSKMTGVSVQTMHHYDRIGLLKPSVRLANGYRLYSEKDLLKLQQIIALKFFGFELSKIKFLLDREVNVRSHLEAQSGVLAEKAQTLIEASKTLDSIISGCDEDKSIPWEKVIQLIEVYTMTQKAQKTWVAKALNPEEIQDLARFDADLNKRFTEKEKQAFEKTWANFLEEVAQNIDCDPAGPSGIEMGKRCMDMVNGWFTSKYAGLRETIWEKGFQGGLSDLSPGVVSWLDKAIDTYYRGRIYEILARAENPSSELAQEWQSLMEEMYGDAEARKQEVIVAAMTDENVNVAARQWLQQFSKS
ncbi:MAG: MerR family transcriptional regulator [Alphaproteobacteria bacterium]|nr:MerR family transcriptional regulator [Alphaproteobacteria bacterium]